MNPREIRTWMEVGAIIIGAMSCGVLVVLTAVSVIRGLAS